MRPSTAGVYGTVAIVLLTNVCHGYDSMPATIGDPRADSLGKSMAQLFLAKEETVPGAKHSMDIFQAIAQEHILQNWAALKEQRLQEVNQYNQKTLVDPTLKYLNETQQEHLKGLQPNITAIEDAVEPDLGYFADPKQNVVKDFFKFATRSGTSAGSVAGPDIIDYAPCLIANTPAGVSVSASAIQVIPQLIAATPYGVTVIPQGINIQPALIQIKPYGLDVSPIGLDIEPILISIRPHLEVVGPEELNVGPSVVEVAGRKLLTGDSIKNRESSHTDLFLQSYQSWIQVIANMATGNEASPQEANSFLAKVFQSSGQHLDAFQQLTAFFEGIINQQGVFNQTQDFQEAMAEFSQLYPVEILQEMLNGSLSNPSFNISSLLPAGLAYTDPQFFHNQASNISSTTQGLSISSAFINYRPCIVANTPDGVNIGPAGIVVQPNGINIKTVGVNIQPRGINLQPSLIYINPVGEGVTPEGLQIIPTVISVNPTYHMVGKHAHNIGKDVISVDKTGKVKFNTDQT